MTGKLSKNFDGVAIGPLSNILAVKWMVPNMEQGIIQDQIGTCISDPSKVLYIFYKKENRRKFLLLARLYSKAALEILKGLMSFSSNYLSQGHSGFYCTM